MNGADEYAVAQGNTRLIPNLNTTCKMEVPGDLPGVVIFLHGVNDPGASYEPVETGLCQGVNERLDRPDLVPGRYGAEYAMVKKLPAEDVQDGQKDILDDPDTYLYQRDTKDPKTRSLLIPFYWGYRADPSEISRDKNNNPTKLRDQYQDIQGNRLDRHFGKAGGYFVNATNNLLEMYDKGLPLTMRLKIARKMLPNTHFLGDNPHRRYYVLAAHRLAMMVKEIRRVSPDETITIMAHSQGTLITLLAQALLVDGGHRCADTIIMVDTPYCLFPEVTPKDQDTLSTLTRIVAQVTQAPHTQPPLSDLCNPATYCGRSGPQWSPTQGTRLDSDRNMTVFPERDNRGKVYLYFCPDDTTVALDDVRGIGTYGVWDTHGKDSTRNPMAELKAVRFFQRMWTKRYRDGSPVMVGKPPGYELLRAKNESRYPGGGFFTGLISKGPIEEGHKILINAEQLYPPHAPAMFGGEEENFRGDETKSGLDRPDDANKASAVGNPRAKFNWRYVRSHTGSIDLERELAQWNLGKAPSEQTRIMRKQRVTGDGAPKPTDRYDILREETPDEIREFMDKSTDVLAENSYHSGLLRSPENQRWVTAMDIAIGQAKCLDDPVMRDVLVAIADWKMDKKQFAKTTELPGWERISEESQELVSASHLYYEEGEFPSDDLVTLTPPPLLQGTQQPRGVK
ncbi:T6SS effector phospholipase Tle3 domain-containing protein [Pseudomonas fragariae (ex Marin et al. 2024)]|uniref:T6SS effector phospholipase Tle3 domain-containing protein n=1 Tax=Pseudomonas fragariae (ex Marin et al. 2024) TaxID=3080056 RepID=UPI003F7A142C